MTYPHTCPRCGRDFTGEDRYIVADRTLALAAMAFSSVSVVSNSTVRSS